MCRGRDAGAGALWPPGRAAPEDVAASPPHAQPSCPWPKPARGVVVWALSQCGPHLGFLAIFAPRRSRRRGARSRLQPAHRLHPQRLRNGPMLPVFDNPRSWGRGGAHTASDGQARTPARAASLRPAASERAHRPHPTPPAARRRPARARARRARPPTPHGSAGCRRRGCRLASTASRSCTQRAGEAPAVAADRSLSGRCRLRCSRPAEPGLFRAKRARGAAAPHAAAPSRPLQPGGQRSHRTTEDRGSRQSASMSARHARPYRRRRAHAAAQPRPAAPLAQAVTLHARRPGCRLCKARSLVISISSVQT